MNNGHDDLEHLITDSLRERSASAPRPTRSLTDVDRRVEQRQTRRRRTAAGVASLAVVTVGIVGLATVGRGGTPDATSTDDFVANTFSGSTTVPQVAQLMWGCTGAITPEVTEPGFSYFEHCHQLATTEDATFVPTTTIPSAGVEATDMPVQTTTTIPSAGVEATDMPVQATTTVPNGYLADRDGMQVFLHNIRTGDNPSRVAAVWGVTVERLTATNLNNANWLSFPIGGELWVPDTGHRPVELSPGTPVFDPTTMTAVPGEPVRLELGIHCGVRVIPTTINGWVWRTMEAPRDRDWLPEEWMDDPNRPDGPITVTAALTESGHLTVTLNGHTVVYDADGTEFEGPDLCD